MRTTSLKNNYGDSFMKYLLLITLVLFPSIHSYAYSHEGEIDLREGATTSISLKPTYIRNLTQTSGISVLNYNWRSTNTTVCSVTSSSLTTCTIRADRSGTAEIQYDCSFMWDGYYRTFAFKWDVTVEASTVFVTQIDFDNYSMSLFEGQSDRIVASVYPTNATNRSVTWSSNRSSVASVTQSGWVTANSVGTATITCSADDGSGVYETCLVTVLSSIVYVTDIELNKTSLSLTTGGSSQQLSATITPSNASNKNVSWTSSDTNVANVSSDGLVSPVSAGECIITCMAKDGSGVSRTCSIIVSPSRVPVSTINLNQTTASLFVNGPTLQLTATVLPENASDRSVTWSSSDEDVATVNENGLVKAVSPGTATITCKANDGSGVTSECAVTVNWTNADIDIVSVSCDNENLNELTQNDVISFHATFKNSGETDFVDSRFVLFNEEQTKLIGIGERIRRTFPGGGELTIVDYKYSLDTISEGHYYATVVWRDKNDGRTYYKRNMLKAVTIGDNTPDPFVTDLAEGSYYLQNVATNKYITCGGSWGGHIALDNRGLVFELQKAEDDACWNIFSSFLSNIGTQGAIGTEGYINNYEGIDLILTYLGDGKYTIKGDNGYLLMADTDGKLADFEGESPDDRKAQWIFIDEDELFQQRLEKMGQASAAIPVDATFLIEYPNINNAHDQRQSALNINAGRCAVHYGTSIIDTEPIMEVFRSSESSCSDAFSISQPVILYHTGLYKLEVQGFYRDGDYTIASQRRSNGIEKVYAYLFAGENKTPLKSIFDDATETRQRGFNVKTIHGYIPNTTMTDAGYTFQTGAYDNELYFNVEDISRPLVIGIKGETSHTLNNWTTLDNFRLTYYGNAPMPSSASLSIDPFNIGKSEEKKMYISLENPDDEIASVTFDLVLPTGLYVKQTAGEYDFDIAGRTTWRKHYLVATGSGSTINFALTSNNGATIEGNSGKLIEITLQANNSFYEGDIKLKDIILTTSKGEQICPSNVDYPVGLSPIIVKTKDTEVIYNLSGQRLSAPQRGVNIINGKKVVIK